MLPNSRYGGPKVTMLAKIRIEFYLDSFHLDVILVHNSSLNTRKRRSGKKDGKPNKFDDSEQSGTKKKKNRVLEKTVSTK